jgi:uncharacterized protein YxjI
MTYNEEIKKLKDELYLVRTNLEYSRICKKILKLAKKYNTLNYRDEYLIIDNNVYELRLRK